MKYHIYCTILFILLHSFILAQTASDRVLDEACICLQTTDFNTVSMDSIDIKADSCISEAIIYNLTALLREQKVDLDDDKDMQELGEFLAELLFTQCAAFREYSVLYAIKQTEIQRLPYQRDTGQILSVETSGLYTFIYIWQGEKEVRYLWLREFDGSSRFFSESWDLMRDKKIEILWNPIELYDIYTQSYQNYKEIKLMEELETVELLEKRLYKRLAKARKKKYTFPK
ncbi:MAG: hypothetical protein MK212_02925 [Saprospiraceae bacterium]|nr:hypothetical protein [Saprospiraceae bacterium]